MLKRFAPAKINLSLDVTAKRPDGYHEVDMVMQSIDLADEIYLSANDRGDIVIDVSEPRVPSDRRNLAWRAAELLQQTAGVSHGVTIRIEKKIPMAAGLAGGSSDAAAVLTGLNEMWKLGLSKAELMDLGLKLGADVPFCIDGQTSRAQGIGERLRAVRSRLSCPVLIVTPDIEVSTAWVYQHLDLKQIQRHPQMEKVLEAIETGNLDELSCNWGNVLENVVLSAFPIVAELKHKLTECGMKHILMSGSGPTVFVLDPAVEAVERFIATAPSTWFSCLTRLRNKVKE